MESFAGPPSAITDDADTDRIVRIVKALRRELAAVPSAAREFRVGTAVLRVAAQREGWIASVALPGRDPVVMVVPANA